MADEPKDLEKQIIRDPSERKEFGQIEPDKAVHPQIRPESPQANPEE